MDSKRRNFLKKTGLFTAAGFIPGIFSARTGAPVNTSRKHQPAAFIIQNATVITMDEELGQLKNASVLVKEGKIAEVGQNIAAPEGIEIINARGFIVMPGIIDCHRHLWTSLLRSMAGDREQEGYFPMTKRYSRLYTVDDMRIAAQYAAAEAINSGITTVSDYNHNAQSPEYVMASCNALAETGIRAHVIYGNYRDKKESEPTDFDGIKTVMEELQEDEKYAMISLGLGSRGVGYKNLQNDWEKAREMGLRITIHAGQHSGKIGEIQQLADMNLLGEDVNIIHANVITPSEIEAVKKANTSITMTPFSEMRIGFGFPKINELSSAGINLSIGIDTVALTGNADLFSTMKLLLNLSNGLAKNEFYMDHHEIIKTATINGARTLGLEDITGSLTPGKRADLIMLNRNDLNFSSGSKPEHLVVEAVQPQNVDMVVIDGKILKRDGKLTGINVDQVVESAEDSFERMYQAINK